jgi:hypothetical protein
MSVRDSGSTRTDKLSPNYTTERDRNLRSSMTRNESTPYGTLSSIAIRALRQYGDMAPDVSYSGVADLMIDFANEIIEDIRQHPYATIRDRELDYYTHTEDTREVPDNIMKAGLMHRYASQQESTKAPRLRNKYYNVLNQTLFNRRYGHQKIEMQPLDKTDFTEVGDTAKVNPNTRFSS